MIIVHDVFICKPGNASKLAKKFKEGMTGNSDLVNIMTDMTGQFNKVIMVTKYDSLTAYEKSWEKYQEKSEEMKKMEQAMAGYQDMYLTGFARFIRSGNILCGDKNTILKKISSQFSRPQIVWQGTMVYNIYDPLWKLINRMWNS